MGEKCGYVMVVNRSDIGYAEAGCFTAFSRVDGKTLCIEEIMHGGKIHPGG